MKQVNQHIISSLNWNTSFDKKESAAELQSRLSTWSNIRLQRELANLFDSICPPGQTWKIGSIELDLGTIEYSQLEPELSLRVKKQLLEKLLELISYPERNGNTDFEILDEDISALNLLESFLANGVMPWNRPKDQEPVDAMMLYQLKHNRVATIEMLWETGALHDNVRKRIAWQFSDPTVIMIIEGLEPNNHGQIIDFSDRMMELQAKESIVESSVADLRKNIWHWILNYLFNDRGTVFNKIAFLKSTIRQMAAHHNVRYEELVDLIERAVSKIKKSSGLSPDFILTLNTLSEENSTARKKEAAALEPVVDHWYVLETLFRDPFLRRTESHHAEFNDLVASLYRNDKKRLGALVQNIGREEELRISAVADLSERSLEIIFSSLFPAGAGTLLKSIGFLQALGKEMKVWREDKILWRAALKFAIENKRTTIDNKAFIVYCVNEIAKEIGRPAEKILAQLANAPVPPLVKTISSLEIYSDLQKVAEENNEAGSSWPAQLKALIGELGKHINSGREIMPSLRRAFLEKIKRNPGIALEILASHPQKNIFMPFLAEAAIADVLLRSPKLHAVFSQVEQAIHFLEKDNRTVKLAEALKQHLQEWSLEAFIMQPGADTAHWLEYILNELILQYGDFSPGDFKLLYDELGNGGNPVLKKATEKILRDHSGTEKLPLIARVKKLMLHPGKTHYAIGRMLSAHFSDAEFTAWRKPGRKESAAVLDFLLAGGEKWRKTLVAEYKIILSPYLKIKGESALEIQLDELYWKCILDYDAHGGKIAALRKLFHMAALYKFPLPGKEIAFTKPEEEKAKRKPATEKIYALKNGEAITMRELFMFIAECLEKGKEELIRDAKKYELAELLDLGLELKPSEIRKIISGMPLTEARLNVLKNSGSFRRLSLWIMSDLRGEMNSAMEAMRMLHDMITLIIPGETTGKFLDEFWAQAWAVITAGSWSQEDLKKLIRNSLTKLAAEFNVSAANFLSEMKDKKIRLTPLLRDNLIACFPAFAALPGNEKETTTGRKLAGFESRGLLDGFIDHLITQKKTPSWFGDSGEEEIKAFLQEIIVHHPVRFLQAIKRETISETRMRWLHRMTDFSELTRSISYLSRDKQAPLSMLAEFHLALGKITVRGISAGLLQEILFSKLIKAWTGNNWRMIMTENIWNEIVWDVCVKYNIPEKDFLHDLEKAGKIFPPALKIALEKLAVRDTGKGINPIMKTTVKKKPAASEKKHDQKTRPAGIAVYNAGLVMLNSYIQVLFERLGITSEKKFISTQAQNDAVHYLQYVVTGLSRTEESFLPLNKILCGLPLSHPVQDGITISSEQKNLADGLIKAAIAHWPSIGDTSIEGFRGNWLVREGMLAEQESRWELTVEKRAYDILLNKSPYSFSIIKYPWMDKLLHVTWPY